MNFIALIGIVEELQKITNQLKIKLKIEKPFVEKSLSGYEYIDVNLDNFLFKTQLPLLTKGSIIGVKGRLKQFEQNLMIVGERIQIF